ncbi:hypothetical protein ONZ51_g3585 [Trametes cubensis]|uniref:Uncharacterized protein n=1 Tax=Trametes cubensis TaxID=1111947 RepID=A0AAD7TXH1_9APHY|nr:hypothetical protein ONZ51_g3585 [Trametes cubensis]
MPSHRTIRTPARLPGHPRAKPVSSPLGPPGPPPAQPLPSLPPAGAEPDTESDKMARAWAVATTRFSTLSGAHTLSADDVNALKEVPREGALEGARITRARSQIMESPSIVFSFKTGPRHLRRMGMPVYALATASKDELLKHMSGGASYAATSWREYPPEAHTPALQWPLLDELRYQHIRTDEWVKVDESMSKIQLAMDVAYLCNRFFEKYRWISQDSASEWHLRRDAFYRVWLVGLERTGHDVFEVVLKYVQDFPGGPS